MTSTYQPSPSELDLMERYRAKGWEFSFRDWACEFASGEICAVQSPRIHFDYWVDCDGIETPLTEESLLDQEARDLVDEQHYDEIDDALEGARKHLTEQLVALYRCNSPKPTEITTTISIST